MSAAPLPLPLPLLSLLIHEKARDLAERVAAEYAIDANVVRTEVIQAVGKALAMAQAQALQSSTQTHTQTQAHSENESETVVQNTTATSPRPRVMRTAKERKCKSKSTVSVRVIASSASANGQWSQCSANACSAEVISQMNDEHNNEHGSCNQCIGCKLLFCESCFVRESQRCQRCFQLSLGLAKNAHAFCIEDTPLDFGALYPIFAGKYDRLNQMSNSCFNSKYPSAIECIGVADLLKQTRRLHPHCGQAQHYLQAQNQRKQYRRGSSTSSTLCRLSDAYFREYMAVQRIRNEMNGNNRPITEDRIVEDIASLYRNSFTLGFSNIEGENQRDVLGHLIARFCLFLEVCKQENFHHLRLSVYLFISYLCTLIVYAQDWVVDMYAKSATAIKDLQDVVNNSFVGRYCLQKYMIVICNVDLKPETMESLLQYMRTPAAQQRTYPRACVRNHEYGHWKEHAAAVLPYVDGQADLFTCIWQYVSWNGHCFYDLFLSCALVEEISARAETREYLLCAPSTLIALLAKTAQQKNRVWRIEYSQLDLYRITLRPSERMMPGSKAPDMVLDDFAVCFNWAQVSVQLWRNPKVFFYGFNFADEELGVRSFLWHFLRSANCHSIVHGLWLFYEYKYNAEDGIVYEFIPAANEVSDEEMFENAKYIFGVFDDEHLQECFALHLHPFALMRGSTAGVLPAVRVLMNLNAKILDFVRVLRAYGRQELCWRICDEVFFSGKYSLLMQYRSRHVSMLVAHIS